MPYTHSSARTTRPATGVRGAAAAVPSPTHARLLAMLACFTLLWSVAALGEVYRYVDENGVTVYSQTPPPSGEAASMTPDPGPSATETAAALERLRRQLETDFDRRYTREKRAEHAAEEAARAEQRAAACAAARTNLRTLTNLGAAYLELPDGTLVGPTREQRQRLIEQTRGQVRDLCD